MALSNPASPRRRSGSPPLKTPPRAVRQRRASPPSPPPRPQFRRARVMTRLSPHDGINASNMEELRARSRGCQTALRNCAQDRVIRDETDGPVTESLPRNIILPAPVRPSFKIYVDDCDKTESERVTSSTLSSPTKVQALTTEFALFDPFNDQKPATNNNHQTSKKKLHITLPRPSFVAEDEGNPATTQNGLPRVGSGDIKLENIMESGGEDQNELDSQDQEHSNTSTVPAISKANQDAGWSMEMPFSGRSDL